jgi:hypothetical protein
MSRPFTTPIERREFQRQIINDLRAGEAIRGDDSFLAAIEEKLRKRFPAGKRVETAGKWLDELVQEGVLVPADDGKLKLNPQPIVGESAWKRFENLPPDPAEPRLATDLLLLYGLNSFLFLLLSFFFLPDSLVKVLGSAAGVALGILGLKSLNPRETDNVARSSRYRIWLIAMLIVAGIGQATILGIGFAFPCKITAIPGSTVLVDGKFLERTPDLTEEERKETKGLFSPDNIRPWLTPRLNSHYLRWDTHEIKITKKWYVDAERSQESVQNVSVDLARLWNPKKAFRKWEMKTEQKALLKIDYGVGKQGSGTPDEDSPAVDSVFKESQIRDVVEEWDKVWTAAMDQRDVIGHKRTEPYVAAIQLVEDRSTPHFEFQIRDWTDRPLKPLKPIRPRQQRLAGSDQLSDSLTSIREEVFEQLLDELGIPERISLAPATNQLAALSQQLITEVETSAALPTVTPASTMPPSRNPDVSPPPSASPASTAVVSSSPSASAMPSPSPAPTAIVLRGPVSVVQKLQQVATDAAKNDQLDVAVAAQQQLKAAISQVAKSPSDRTSKLVSALEQSQDVVARAIREKGVRGRIYVHIADESQREPAKKVATPLTTNNHFAVVGIQNVGGRAYIPDTAEVRYFADFEATKQAASEIAAALNKANIPKPRPIFVKPSAREIQESTDINTHFEIWFARDSFSGKNQDESK